MQGVVGPSIIHHQVEFKVPPFLLPVDLLHVTHPRFSLKAEE
jgi:hypothetical protein